MRLNLQKPPARRKTRLALETNDPRPTIRLVAGDIERIVDESELALIKADRGLFQRAGKIVFVADSVVVAAHGRTVVAQRILERGDHALLEDLACSAHFTKYEVREKGDVAANPPIAIVHTLRERVGRLRFRVLTGVINAPTLRADGSLLAEPGYDAATGLLFNALGVEFPKIAEHPTRAEALAALALLSDLVATFPFVAEVDRAVALSAILTALLRRSMPTAPLHAFTAPVAGSGKSKLVDLASVIATGHEAGVIAQGAREDELEKRLGSILLAADPIVSIDNCEKPLGGELLCQMLTQTRVRTRILGKSKTPVLSTDAFITATGNNLVLVGDLTRRAVICRLNPKHERPETRVFDRDPVAQAKTQRGDYVAAALTMLRAFHVAGRPNKPPPLGSFERWSDLIRGTLLWLGCADPVDSMESLRKADPHLVDLAGVVAQWRATIGDERVTVAEVIRRATERHALPDGTAEFVHADFREALLTVAGSKGAINSRALGKWLSGYCDRIVDGLRFTQLGQRQGVAVWSLAGSARFTEGGFVGFVG